MTENWEAIEGYVGLYEVSSEGRVKSLKRGRVLVPVLEGSGYETVRLYCNGVSVRYRVHRLVCAAFNGPATILHTEVAHLDGTRRNNRASNLKWVSKAENASHRKLHGTHPGGSNHPKAKLSDIDVLAIREELRAGGRICSALARKYGVHNTTIGDIKHGRRWRSLVAEHESAGRQASPDPQQESQQ